MRLRRRLLLLLIGVSLLAALLMDLGGSFVLRKTLRRFAAERLERETALLAGTLLAQGLPAEADLRRLVERMGRDLRLRVTLMAPDGRVLADSDVAPGSLPSLENHLDRPEIRQALSSGTGRSERPSATLGVPMAYFARRVDGPDGTTAYLRLSVPTADLEAGAGSLRAAVAAMALGSFLALGALSYTLTRRLSRPVERIAALADTVASGRYETPIRSEGAGAEVDTLAQSLDRMRRSLLRQIGALEEERRLMDSVLSGMREGLLAVDTGRRVILANASLRRDLGLALADLPGRPLAEVIRDPGVTEAFQRALDERAESRVSVAVRFPAERFLELFVAPLDAPDGRPLGAVGLFLDVTRLQALEKMRREFIADVSHEMRTPIASLRAAVENLQGPAGSDERDRAQFLAIVRRNAERMEALIDDLTDLSLIETGAITLEPEILGLREVVRDAVDALSGRAAAREVALAAEVPPGLLLRGDRRRIDQILVNILDNGIKFNRRGGKVRIGAVAGKGRLVLTVEDSGEGVPPQDLEKIFQRFYRREKSRSREAGGTGLGLAIVKHLMRLHEGSVRAEIRDEGGLRIVLDFPAWAPEGQAAQGAA